MAIGVAAVFMETHESPDTAPSDGPNMVPLGELSEILKTLLEIDRIAKADPVK
ncbi:MAG TPA: 3-deoxy-8-phosphooctulonate synthase, partial [Rhodospirillaceae bacterium]|nr:3-deoxy-8-phosphooctulonate synthase [Rhodospirillaceae bacterium]